MLQEKNTISARQLIFLFIIIAVSPAIRYIPSYTARQAKQAVWLSPILMLITMSIIIFVLQGFFKRYKSESMTQIIYSIMGKFAGFLIVFLYLIWSIILTALYMRFNVERLTSAIYSSINIKVFIFFTLILVAYAVYCGLTPLARMCELVLPFILFLLLLLILFLLPRVKISSLLPVSYLDIIPIVKASFSSIALGSYLFLVFFIGNINNKEKTKVLAYKASFLLVLIIMSLLIITIGTMGATVVERLPIPFLSAVKQISILNTIEKIESFAVAMWMLSDFILITAMAIISLNIIRELFKLQDYKPIYKIFLVFIYIFSIGLGLNRFELETFSSEFIVPVNEFMGVILPCIIYIIGKLRKKV